MFPGQSSAYPEMISKARGTAEAAAAVAERARAVLSEHDAARYLGSAVRLECNRDVQIATFLATQMHLAALAAERITADRSLGMSLGEYSHLVHIGALGFETALHLVATRGAAYDRSPQGVMASITGPERAEVEDAVGKRSPDGLVTISNYNSPTQHVIAGEPPAVRRVAARLEEDAGAQAVEIESRVAMHSPLLDATALEFQPHLAAVPWAAPTAPYVPNVVGASIDHPSPADFVSHLTAHVHRPVRWRQSVEHLAAKHPFATFVEVGPGRVLHNLLSRRWLVVNRLATDGRRDGDPQWRDTLQALGARP